MPEAADWRGPILRELVPKLARLTLVADPDGLLLEETLLGAIRERGFELVTFEDPVAFRFACESKFRSCWDTGAATDNELVLRVEGHDLTALPYDILRIGRQLSFSLSELLPDLSYPVVASLDRGDLDPLYRAWAQHGREKLGDDTTKDFVLQHVFGIASAPIRQPSDLLRVLLRKHYGGRLVPRSLDDRLVRALRQGGAFGSWPLERIVPDRQAFFAFLQERWPRFLDRLAGSIGVKVRDANPGYHPEVGGPTDLPFDHEDVRIYIDNLFLEGMLRPVPHAASHALRDEWVAPGIRTDPDADRSRRLEGLLEAIGDTIPDPDARHRHWSAFAWRWAELGVLWSETSATARSDMNERMIEARTSVDRAFEAWVEHRYGGLHNQPPNPPVMVHHLPRYLDRRLPDTPGRKAALVVVDGLALEQWLVLRDVLAGQRPCLGFHQDIVFAWVPTITCVSRQAIFAGIPPLYFPSSIRTTDREASLWSRFWVDHGLRAYEVTYAKGLGDGPLDRVHELLSRPGIRVLGLVVDKVDRIMHGMELGAAGMLNQVRQWAEEGFMAGLLDALFDHGFAVFLTSDHGNIEAEGCGRPSEGAIADLRGERARIYSDPILRSQVQERFPDAIAWPAVGLPEDCLALLASGRSAFVRKGERIVGHGGVSLEEVVVPMIEIERRTE